MINITYIAKQDIAGYKAGEVVPAEKAELWNKMYKESPTIEMPEASAPIKEQSHSLDINKDGKVDTADAAIASKVLNEVKNKKEKKK